MDNKSIPNLTEPGVTYFLKQTLIKCNERKSLFYNTILNMAGLFFFISILGIILVYKKNNKLTPQEIKSNKIASQQYMLERIKQFREKRAKESNDIITSLPRFESNFVRLHKNYYNI